MPRSASRSANCFAKRSELPVCEPKSTVTAGRAASGAAIGAGAAWASSPARNPLSHNRCSRSSLATSARNSAARAGGMGAAAQGSDGGLCATGARALPLTCATP